MEVLSAGAIPAPPAPSPAQSAHGEGVLRVALIGNPNTGKSTLFNALTGMRQRVGNYSGVTVERVEGRYADGPGRHVTVIDLPGTYSLSAASPDEEIALSVLLGRVEGMAAPDAVVVVVDAQNLERNLFLASQVLELGLPTVVALNQVDAAEAAGQRIDAVELTLQLGVPVVPTVATRGEGLDVLKHAVRSAPGLPLPGRLFALPAEARGGARPGGGAPGGGGLRPLGGGDGGAPPPGRARGWTGTWRACPGSRRRWRKPRRRWRRRGSTPARWRRRRATGGSWRWWTRRSPTPARPAPR